MYTNDKVQRITLRLNESQFEFVKIQAETLGVSPSEFLRMVINSAMVMSTKANEKLVQIQNYMGGRGRENDKADCNNQL